MSDQSEEKVKIVVWPDGDWVLYEDFDYERDYSQRSDDYEIKEISQKEYELLL
jgi:hypothetical protein